MRQSDGRRADYPLIDLERRVRDAEQRLRQIPSRFAGGAAAPAFREVIITGGKALGYGGLTGIKSTNVNIVDTTARSGTYVPATVGTAGDNGLGWGSDLITGELLLVVNAPVVTSAGAYLSGGTALYADLPVGTRILTFGTVSLLDGSATIRTFQRCYLLGTT